MRQIDNGVAPSLRARPDKPKRLGNWRMPLQKPGLNTGTRFLPCFPMFHSLDSGAPGDRAHQVPVEIVVAASLPAAPEVRGAGETRDARFQTLQHPRLAERSG